METKTLTPQEVYAKYVLKAKEQMDKESLAKKQKNLSGWSLVLWILLILITLFIYFWISGFDFKAFRELTDGSLGYWTVAGAFFLGLIFILIVETRKPDPIQINEIFKKAENLIEKAKQEAHWNKQELDTLKEL